MANTRGKSLPQEGERRLVESLRAARLRLFDTPTADILRRLFGERRLVNGVTSSKRDVIARPVVELRRARRFVRRDRLRAALKLRRISMWRQTNSTSNSGMGQKSYWLGRK